jgi:hypothetical protein
MNKPTNGGIALAPHDAAALPSNGLNVHLIQGAVSILGVLEVDIGISQGATSDGITAHTHRDNRTDSIENIK